MRSIIATAALAVTCLVTAPAMAQRSGTYAVEGVAADGTRYEGSAQFQATGPKTWRINWRVSGESFSGVGLVESGLMAVGFQDGRELGAVLYAVQPDGSLLGIFTQGTEGGIGSERLLPR